MRRQSSSVVSSSESEKRDEPVKDGHDHACDALRYLIVSLELSGAPVTRKNYLV